MSRATKERKRCKLPWGRGMSEHSRTQQAFEVAPTLTSPILLPRGSTCGSTCTGVLSSWAGYLLRDCLTVLSRCGHLYMTPRAYCDHVTGEVSSVGSASACDGMEGSNIGKMKLVANIDIFNPPCGCSSVSWIPAMDRVHPHRSQILCLPSGLLAKIYWWPHINVVFQDKQERQNIWIPSEVPHFSSEWK